MLPSVLCMRGRVKLIWFPQFYRDRLVTMSQTLWPSSPVSVFLVQPFLMCGTLKELLECLAFPFLKNVFISTKESKRRSEFIIFSQHACIDIQNRLSHLIRLNALMAYSVPGYLIII